MDADAHSSILFRFGIGGARAYGPMKMVDLRNRAYVAHLRGFLTRDPLGAVDSHGLWNYVAGDPINWRDPWGLEKKEPSTTPRRTPVESKPEPKKRRYIEGATGKHYWEDGEILTEDDGGGGAGPSGVPSVPVPEPPPQPSRAPQEGEDDLGERPDLFFESGSSPTSDRLKRKAERDGIRIRYGGRGDPGYSFPDGVIEVPDSYRKRNHTLERRRIMTHELQHHEQERRRHGYPSTPEARRDAMRRRAQGMPREQYQREYVGDEEDAERTANQALLERVTGRPWSSLAGEEDKRDFVERRVEGFISSALDNDPSRTARDEYWEQGGQEWDALTGQ